MRILVSQFCQYRYPLYNTHLQRRSKGCKQYQVQENWSRLNQAPYQLVNLLRFWSWPEYFLVCQPVDFILSFFFPISWPHSFDNSYWLIYPAHYSILPRFAPHDSKLKALGHNEISPIIYHPNRQLSTGSRRNNWPYLTSMMTKWHNDKNNDINNDIITMDVDINSTW